MIDNPAFLAFVFLCWGSFLNMLAYRLISGASLVIPRSYCPYCHTTLAWFDMVPVLSYIVLRGRCRTCSESISPLYPLIELLTMVSMLGLWYRVSHEYFMAYFVFFSALIVTVRTDFQFMLISRYASIYMIPVAVAFSTLGYLPLSWQESMIASMSGYFFMLVIARVFYTVMKKAGLGQGDIELIACIGAFTGIMGWWISLFLGSLIGSFVGIAYIMFARKDRSVKIPFGPFLALASILYVLFQQELTHVLFPHL